MKKCTKWRIINAVIWVIGGCTLIYEILKAWSDLGCGVDSLTAAFVFYGTFCLLFGALCDSKIRDGFKNDENHFEYR